MTESGMLRCFSLAIGEIDGKYHSLKVEGLSTGKLTFTLLQDTGGEWPDSMKEVGSIMEVVRVAGSEAHELIVTPIDDD